MVTNSTTALMSYTSFSPYVKYYPSLFPHPQKSKAIKFISSIAIWRLSSLWPPFPWRYKTVGQLIKDFSKTMSERLCPWVFLTVSFSYWTLLERNFLSTATLINKKDTHLIFIQLVADRTYYFLTHVVKCLKTCHHPTFFIKN